MGVTTWSHNGPVGPASAGSSPKLATYLFPSSLNPLVQSLLRFFGMKNGYHGR